MKKGFTLIELLAVIVILAIIALIAVPIVLNIINDSKESSLLRSAEFYLDAVGYTIADAFLYHGGLENKEYPITPEGNICKKALPCDEANTLKVEVNGDKPTGGFITINGGNIGEVSIILDDKTIIKNGRGELVYAKYLDEVCKYISGTEKKIGAKYECKVDPNKEVYIFYVLKTPSATDTSINLIMDRNLNNDGTPVDTEIGESTGSKYDRVEWINQSDYELAGGKNWDDYSIDNNIFGPITAMNFLYEATKNWTNTNEMMLDTFDDDLGTIHNMKTYNTHARMPYYNEVKNVVSPTTIWLIDYLHGYDDEDIGITGREHGINGLFGYWIYSAHSSNHGKAWYVTYDGSLTNNLVDHSTNMGIRPVISLSIK